MLSRPHATLPPAAVLPPRSGESTHADLNISLVPQSHLESWKGLPVQILQAMPGESGAVRSEHPMLAMMHKGRSRLTIDSRGKRHELDLRPGSHAVGLFAPAFEMDRARTRCDPGTERLLIELDLSALRGAGDTEALMPCRRTLRQDFSLNDAGLASLVLLITEEVRRGSPHGALYASSLSLSLVAYLFNHHGGGGAALQRERGMLTSSQRQRVVQLIEERLAEDLTLDDLSAAAGIGLYHFVRLFKNSVGVTPHRFLMDRRLHAAQGLLAQGTQSLAEIAGTTGFSSQSHLCTAMKQRLGMTPGAWRRSQRG